MSLKIGLEIHISLSTPHKLICDCSNPAYILFPKIKNPSTSCPICTGVQGALPHINTEAISQGLRLCSLLKCKINNPTSFDRKCYYYIDMPMNYQITQKYYPIGINGSFYTKALNRSIAISDIHIETDAGKIGENNIVYTSRHGVPLAEIVTAPEFNNAHEVSIFLKELKELITSNGISCCRMELGELRCDVNISVFDREKNDYSNKIEIKNMNSFSFISQAISFEEKRLISLLKNNEAIISETRGFDEKQGETYSMRKKEATEEYLYMHEPDIPAIYFNNSILEEVGKFTDSELVNTIYKLAQELDIEVGITRQIIADSRKSFIILKSINKLTNKNTDSLKTIFNLLGSESFDVDFDFYYVGIDNIATELFVLSQLFINEDISFATVKKLYPQILSEKIINVLSYIKDKGLLLIKDESLIKKAVTNVLTSKKGLQSKSDYLAGNKKSIEFIIGLTMKELKGQVYVPLLRNIIIQSIES